MRLRYLQRTASRTQRAKLSGKTRGPSTCIRAGRDSCIRPIVRQFRTRTGRPVDGGGENSIAVYAINQQTGEPTLIQSADTRGAEPRTFALDPSARILVAANQTAIFARSGANAKTIPASLAVFRHTQRRQTGFLRANTTSIMSKGSVFWMGIVPLAVDFRLAILKPLNSLVGAAGLEPATLSLEG